MMTSVCNYYLLWFESLATRNTLIFSQKILIFICIVSSFIKLGFFIILLNVCLAISTDVALRIDSVRKKIGMFLKIHTTPELFEIFGNSGTAATVKAAGKIITLPVVKSAATATATALALDHFTTQTGLNQAARCYLVDQTVSDPGIATQAKVDIWKNTRSIAQEIVSKKYEK